MYPQISESGDAADCTESRWSGLRFQKVVMGIERIVGFIVIEGGELERRKGPSKAVIRDSDMTMGSDYLTEPESFHIPSYTSRHPRASALVFWDCGDYCCARLEISTRWMLELERRSRGLKPVD